MASSPGIIQLWVFPTEPEGPSINDVMQERGRGGGPFSMTRHAKGRKGIMRYMTSYLEKNAGQH